MGLVVCVGGSAATGAQTCDLCVACAGRSRQAAITSPTRAGEPAVTSIPQVGVFMRIGLSFRFGSDKFSVSMARRAEQFQRGFATPADT